MSTSEVKRFGADLGMCLLVFFFLKLFREIERHLKISLLIVRLPQSCSASPPELVRRVVLGSHMHKGLPVGLCLCGSAPQQTEEVTWKIGIVSGCACSLPCSMNSKLCTDALSASTSVNDGARAVPPGYHGTGKRPLPSDAAVLMHSTPPLASTPTTVPVVDQ